MFSYTLTSLYRLTGLLLTLSAAPAVLAGGYVTAYNPIIPSMPASSFSTPPPSIFNNAAFTNMNLVSAPNNNLFTTPSTKDPISTVTGNNYHDETDFTIRGRNGLNTVFTRTYNSQPSASGKLGDLGYGWVHSYGMRLTANDYGNCPNCAPAQAAENGNGKTSSITYTDERGGEHNYPVTEDAAHTVTAPQGEFDNLAFNTPAVGRHTLTFRNGTQYVFETEAGPDIRVTPAKIARLKTIKNAWGDQLNLAYDATAWPGHLTTVTDNLSIAGRSGLALTYYPTPDSRLKDVTDWSGRKWSFTYANNQLTTRTNPLLQSLSYTYLPGHLLKEVIQPLTRDGLAVRTVFAYYQNGRGYSQTNGLGQGDWLDYDLYRKSTRVTDSLGHVRDFFYDADGRMTRLTEADGGILLFENQGDAIRSKKYDALGYATTYSYRIDKALTGNSDSFGNVTRTLDAKGYTEDTGYGPLDQIASHKDKRNNTSTTAFASATTATAIACGDYVNRPQSTRLSSLSGATNVLLSSQCWNLDATLNYSRQYQDAAHYAETRLSYQAGSSGLNIAQLQHIGQPSGIAVTQTYTYDNLGRKKTETLKRRTSPTVAATIDLTSSYDYDALDRVIKVTDSLGNEVINNFDANGQLWKVTHRYKKPDATYDVRDVVTKTFDATERVKTETDAAGSVTSYKYDANGNVIAVTDAEGHIAQVEYDAMNRKTAVIDATGYRTETRYNLRGEILSVTNANHETVKFETDELGRKTAQIDPLGFRTEFKYDANNNLTCVIDANAKSLAADPGHQPLNSDGCTESRSYDELNRLIQSKDAQNAATIYSYDLQGHRLSVKDAENKTWSFVYDDLGRLNSETDHSGKIISYKPDEAGNSYEKTNRLLETSRYSYDNASRLNRVDYLKDNSFETFGYDPAGNKNAATNAQVSYAFVYDNLNRLSQKTDSRARSMSFTYDKVGNMLTKTPYQGGISHYTYNDANRLISLNNIDYLQVDYQYDGAGRQLSRIMSSGAKSVYQYNASGQLTKLSQYDAATQLIADTQYTRDRTGNILSQTETGGANPGGTAYAYDPEYRLLTADYPGTSKDEVFSYDKVGNRKTYTQGSLINNATTRYYNYIAATNHLLDIRIGSAVGTIESGYSHNDEGQLITQTGLNAKTITWDAKGRMHSLGSENYAYDPMDYRIGRQGGALGSLDYFLEGEHLESVYSAGVLKEKYFRGANIDELVAGYLTGTDGKSKPYLFHHDALTSNTAVSGHNGGVIQATSFGAFGNVLNSTGTSPNRLKYTGREDEGNGCYYYRARFYCTKEARFSSEDPKGFSAGVNFYAYVGNNPVNANDPSGELPLPVRLATGGVGAVASAIGSSIGQLADVDNFSLKNVGIAAGVGFVAGFTAPQTAFRSIVTGGVSNIAQYGITQTVNNQDITANGVIVNGVTGVVGGWLGGPVSSAGLRYSENLTSIDSSVAHALNNQLDIQLNTTINAFSRNILGSTFSSTDFSSVSSAFGGSVIYPNTSNTNMISSVYSK